MSRTAQANEKAEFCSTTFEWPWPVVWLDTTGVLEIDADRRATFTLSTWGMGDHYQGFLVTIASKTHGEIAKKMFLFDDYLPRTVRSDDRQDQITYPGSDGNPCFQVIAYCGWGWYIAVPRTTQPFVDGIAAYVESRR